MVESARADATVSVNGCDVGVPTPLVAVRVSGYVPPLPDAAIPLSIALPFPLSVNLTPVGSVPDSLKDGVGVPAVVTVKLPAAPTVNIALLALVIVGVVPEVKLTLGELALLTVADWLAGVNVNSVLIGVTV